MSHSPEHCMLCRRREHLTRHHLIPRALHKRKRIRRSFSREEREGSILWVCRPCHSKIHTLFSEAELARHYYSRDRLLAHEEMRKFVAWLAEKPDGFRPKGKMRRRT